MTVRKAMESTVTNNSPHKMGMHQTYHVDSLTSVKRVPGGWIYTEQNDSLTALAMVFIPYNDEFRLENIK